MKLRAPSARDFIGLAPRGRDRPRGRPASRTGRLVGGPPRRQGGPQRLDGVVVRQADDRAVSAQNRAIRSGILPVLDRDQVVGLLDGGEQRPGKRRREFAPHPRGAQGVVLPGEDLRRNGGYRQRAENRSRAPPPAQAPEGEGRARRGGRSWAAMTAVRYDVGGGFRRVEGNAAGPRQAGWTPPAG